MKLSILISTVVLSIGLLTSTAAADDVAPEPVLQYLPGPLPEIAIPAPPVDYGAVIAYMRTLDPETLIRITFEGTGATERMLKIARRESGLGRHSGDPRAACSAKNPRSSASGLFQTLYGWNGTAVANHLSWSNIQGPDCLDDVILARKIWDRSGFGPWS